MVKRAAAKLKIQWPEVRPDAPRSCYDGEKLPKVKRTKQLLPAFPECCRSLLCLGALSLIERILSVAGSSVLNCEGMETHGFRSMPPVEPVLAAHIHPKTSLLSLGSVLPNKADWFQSTLMDKVYKAAALTVPPF